MRRALAALLAGLALTGCTSSDPGEPDPSPSSRASSPASSSASSASVTPTPTAAPTPPAPAVDACYRLTYDAAVAPATTAAAVPCKQRHSSQTYAVGTLDLVSGGHLLAVDSDAARAQVARQCPGKLARYVGVSPEQLRLSMLRPIWFTPTVEQGDQGATWYRCDLIALAGDAELARVEESLRGALADDDTRAAYAMCGTAQPGSAGFEHVLCRQDHTWEAITVVDLSDSGPGYPGEKAVRAAGEDDTCADAAREVAADTLDFEWGYEWPTKDQWAAGQTYGRCWAPS